MNLVDYVIDRPRDTNQSFRTVDYVVDHPRQQPEVAVPKETNLIDYLVWHTRQAVPADAVTANQQQSIMVYR